MADRLISIDTTRPPGSQLPVAVREELAQYSALNPTAEITGAYTAAVNDMARVVADAATDVTLPAGADGTRVVGVHLVSGDAQVTLHAASGDTLIAADNGITEVVLQGTNTHVGLSVWRYNAAGSYWHPISMTALPAADDLVDASLLGRTIITTDTAADIRSLLGAVSSDAVAELFGTSWVPPVYDAKAATGYTAYASVTGGLKTLPGFTPTAGAFEVVAVFGYRSAGAVMALSVTSDGVDMVPASDLTMGGGAASNAGNASFGQLFILPDASGSAHDIVVSWSSNVSCSPNISVGVMSFTGVSTYGAADVVTGSASGTSMSHSVSSAADRVVANLMWHEPLTGTGVIAYSGLQPQSVPAGSYGQASQGYAAGAGTVTFTGTRTSGADWGSIAVQLTGEVTYDNAAVLLEDTTAFTQDLLTSVDAAAARSKLSAAELVGGKLPVSQLPTTAMEYKGIWDASSNTPTLADGTGDAGDTYRVSVAGTRDLGSGSATYGVGDLVLYDGAVWQRSESASATTIMTGTCSTAAGTTAKTVTLDAPWASRTPVDGDWLFITFTNGQTAPYPITLDANGSGAKIVTQVGYGDPQVATVVFAGGGMLLRFMGSAYACTPQASGNASVMTGTCSTAAGTADKTVTLDDPWSSGSVSLQETSLIAVRYTSGQTAAAPTLAVNGMAAMPIYGPRGDTNAGSLTVGANSIAYYRYTSVPSNRLIALSGAPEIADADITAAAGTVTGLVSGRRAEALLAGEASKTRTLTSKTLVAPTVSAVTPSATFGADLAPAGGLGDAAWTKAGGTTWSSPDLTVPSGGTVSCSVTVTSGKQYYVAMTRTAQSGGDLTVTLGAASVTGTYWLPGLTVTAAASGSLTLTVGGGTWVGTVQAITVKEVTALPSPVADLGGHPARTPGVNNVGVGKDALKGVVGGTASTGFGYEALMQMTDGQSNTGFGYRVGRAITTGVANTAVGANAQRVNATGSSNTSIGDGVHNSLVSGTANTAVGGSAMQSLTGGSNNTAVGYAAQYSAATSLGANTAVGANSQRNNTGGFNAALGSSAQYNAVTTSYNVALGAYAQYGGVNTGGSNTAIGGNTQYGAVTGSNNVAVGASAQYTGPSGSSNVAVGYAAQYSLTSGGSNIAVGINAGYSLSAGSNNITVGVEAANKPSGNVAWATTTASRQTVIGREAGQGSATQSDDIVTVGYRALGDGAKATAIGTQANCAHAGSVALGSDTATTSTAQVAVGPRDIEVQDAAKGVVLKSPDGSRWRIKIDNAGVISGTKL